MTKKSVLFICLGNICRSPIAEAVFRHKVNARGLSDKWDIDSAALGDWHLGGRQDSRGKQCLKNHGMSTDHVVRALTKADFTKYDVIFGMDHDNMEELNERKPKNSTAQLKLLGEYDPQNVLIIEDPYYGEDKDFETVFTQCDRCCENFLDKMSS